jgi:MraZ protein
MTLPLAFRLQQVFNVPCGRKWEQVGINGGTSPGQNPHSHDRGQLWELAAKGNAVFLGQYERTVDDKGRLAIPGELRNGLGHGAVMTRSFDNCLCIYPAAKWEALAQAANDLQDLRPEARMRARALFSGAVPCDFDSQGRVIVPAFLREHAGISDEVTVIGVGSRVEVWSRTAWNQLSRAFQGLEAESVPSSAYTASGA